MMFIWEACIFWRRRGRDLLSQYMIDNRETHSSKQLELRTKIPSLRMRKLGSTIAWKKTIYETVLHKMESLWVGPYSNSEVELRCWMNECEHDKVSIGSYIYIDEHLARANDSKQYSIHWLPWIELQYITNKFFACKFHMLTSNHT